MVVLIQNITLGDVCFILKTVDRLNACSVEDDEDKCVADALGDLPTRSLSGTGGRGG
jgi:hypothetical protein